jgi:GTPase involved in cell partitioning and DNA repair
MNEASSLNPEPSIVLEETVYIKVYWFINSSNLALNNSNLQSIVNKNGVVKHVHNNSKHNTETTQEVTFLKKEIEYLKQALKDKEEIIALLKDKYEKD